MANAPATTKWRHACDTSADGTRCIWRRAWCRSFRTAGHQEGFEPLDGGGQFVLLDCPGGVHVLGTNLGALSHERASPRSEERRVGKECRFRWSAASCNR